MSKIKKLVILCFMMLLGSLIVTNSVDATYFSYYDLCTNERLLCAQHHQSMYGANYNLVATINITGNKSTGNGTTVESWHNAKLASILSHPRGQGVIGNGDVENLPVQNAIWNYLGTWRSNVGVKHGISQDFINNAKGNYTTSIETEADTYANNYKEGTLTDKTDVDKIKVTSYTENNKNYLRVGPFKYEFTGTLSEIQVVTNKETTMKIKSFEKCVKENEFKEYSKVEDIKSKDEFYISVEMPTDGSNQIKEIKVKNKTNVKHVEIKFWEHTGHSQQNLLEYTYNDQEVPIETPLPYDIKLLGNLKVIKVNEDNKIIKLKGVGFHIQNKNTSKYVKQASDGTISYVDKKEQATEFITDKNGEITIKNLIVGTYVAYETQNPNYGYEIIKDGKEQTVTVDKTAELEIGNKQKYVKLSGYVWVDKNPSKQSVRNNLYNTDEHPNINDYEDDKDILLDGITVRLKDKSGNIIKEGKTSGGGAYLFTDVLVDDLDKYYIEFEYDGLTYTNVVPHIDRNTGSKSAENSTVRDEFNKNFAVVEGKTENTGITRDSNGNEKHKLTYNLDQAQHTATLNNTGLYPITANTNETGYSIEAHYTPGQEEIKYINLGLYEREQPDIALVKDLENVKVAVNGYNHVYNYAQRSANQGEYGDGFNVGVKFGEKYGSMSYSTAVYKSDYEYRDEYGYRNEYDKSKELKVYVTYKLRIKNESSNLQVTVNNIADYYDAKYSVTKVGTGIDNQGNVTGDISHEETTYNDKYTKTIIYTNTEKIVAQDHTDIYVQFELNREAVITILNDGENLNNVAEINSYSVFDKNGNVYAGIDKDSNPGNTIPGNRDTYEDDTDSSPALKLEVADAREMAGKVFLDSTSNELMTGQVRQGDGEYREGELGISGVTVTLEGKATGVKQYLDIDGETIREPEEGENDIVKYTTTTDENGDFYISGYIPGDYTLTYTWGYETYTVQNYKGTIYNDKDRANNKEWYKTTEPRYSDAIDDYNLRQEIDAETKEITGTTTTTMDKMNSTTPTMGIGVEYDTTTTASIGDKYTYRIDNIDFGIVERARQVIDFEKRVSGFKVTLANGQVIADVTIDKDGNMTGQKNHVTYMGPSATNGYIKLELDNELIQGATVQVEYEITVKNNSELDYDTKDYYLYGIPGTEDDIICIKPEGVYDYLDSEMTQDTTKDNSNWSVVSREEYEDKYEYPDKETILESYFNDSKTIVYDEGNRIETYTWEEGGSETSNVTFLLEEWATEVTETRTVRDVKLDNKTILHNADLEKELAPKEESRDINGDPIKLYTSKVLANTDEIDLNNDAEITEVRRTSSTGREITPTRTGSTFYARGETVIITPPTGQDQNYIVIITTIISSLVILGAGVVLIKKKILGNK